MPVAIPEAPAKPRPILGLGADSVGRLFIWVVFLATVSLAVTRQSLWIDEGFTAWYASHPTIHSFFTALVGGSNSPGDPQLIFYLFYVWAWIKIFGASELSLRAANVPFAVLFVATMAWASRRLFWSPNLWVLFCLSPFFWFYLNEARPYAALMAFSAAASVALLAYLSDPERYFRTPWICLCALFLACGSHILAAFLLPVLLALIVASLVEDPGLWVVFSRHWRWPALCFMPPFIALGIFFTWVSTFGVNKESGSPGMANLAFALYEFAGFAGLGPPRNEIRQHPGAAVFAPYWPWILLGVLALLLSVLSSLRSKPTVLFWNLLLSCVFGLAVAFAISVLGSFQVLGRHLSIFFPLLLMLPMIRPKQPRSPASLRIALAAMISLGTAWTISDLRLVLMNSYAKDSYREACSIALAAARRDSATIIWAADPFTARYYGLVALPSSPLSSAFTRDAIDRPILGSAIDPQNWNLNEAQAYFDNSATPIILVLSKAHPFDAKGTWSSMVQSRRFAEIAHLNVFSIYEWKPDK